MQTVYTLTRANRLLPGASFTFNLRQQRACTVLQITDAQIAYAVDGEEEIQYMTNDDRRVFLAATMQPGNIWGRLILRLGRFAKTLNDEHAELLRMLTQADFDTLWGLAIHRVMIAPEKTRLLNLLEQLSSQAKDQPETMEAIVGTQAMKRLLGYVTPIF